MGRFWKVYLERTFQLDNDVRWQAHVRVCHSESKAMLEEAIVRSGEVVSL